MSGTNHNTTVIPIQNEQPALYLLAEPVRGQYLLYKDSNIIIPVARTVTQTSQSSEMINFCMLRSQVVSSRA